MKCFSKNLGLMAMGLLIFSCNEKISPELKSGNTATELNKPSEYFFRVVDDNAVILNYVLHRTGPGHAATKCSINSKTALTSPLYTGEAGLPHDSKTYDISCFFEAEGCSLYFNGISYKVEASKNTCDYISYSPYSFYESIPGATRASWRGIDCDDNTGNNDVVNLIPNAPEGFDTALNMVRRIGCDEMIDTTIPDTTPELRTIEPLSDTAAGQYCVFNRTGRMCDIGTMRFRVTEVYDSASEGQPRLPAVRPKATLDYSCGGTVEACVGGAIKQHPEFHNQINGRVIINTVANEPFSLQYKQPELIGRRAANHDIVNFRKGLAATNLDYGNYTQDILWSDASNNKRYDPNLIEKWAGNRTPSNTPIIDTFGGAPSAEVSNADYRAKIIENGYSATPFAADPFLGTRDRISPFYTFYCLDKAFEIKARIRMIVRDWDRVYPSDTTEFELISDQFMSVLSRRQDLPNNEEEVPGDPDPYNLYNDVDDWDVLVPMERDPGTFVAGSTFWRPTWGWWNLVNFPHQAEGPRD